MSVTNVTHGLNVQRSEVEGRRVMEKKIKLKWFLRRVTPHLSHNSQLLSETQSHSLPFREHTTAFGLRREKRDPWRKTRLKLTTCVFHPPILSPSLTNPDTSENTRWYVGDDALHIDVTYGSGSYERVFYSLTGVFVSFGVSQVVV